MATLPLTNWLMIAGFIVIFLGIQQVAVVLRDIRADLREIKLQMIKAPLDR
jgi:uncharacterized membrane protein